MKKKMRRFKRSFLAMLATFALLAGLLPATSVFAAVTVPKDGKIHVYKLDFSGVKPVLNGDGTKQDKMLSGATGIDGATFRVVAVGQGDFATISPTQTEAEAYYAANSSKVVHQGTTNTDGLFETPTIPAGQYLVYQPAKTGTREDVLAAPMIISVPMMNPDGVTWNNDIWVYTKETSYMGAVSLYKYDGEGSKETTPLGGAMFDLYQVIAREGGEGEGEHEGGRDVLVATDLATASTTNPDTGAVAGYTPIVGHLPVGSYYFIETGAPTGYLLQNTKYHFKIAESDHAYTTEGALDESKLIKIGSVADKDHNVANYPTPTINKALLTRASADMGEVNTWSITGVIPKDIKNYTKYIITDVVDPRLDFSGNFSFMVDGQALDISSYMVDLPSTANKNTLTVTILDNFFTPAYAPLQAHRNYEIKYDTRINSTAVPGEQIPNKATLTYNNGSVSATIDTAIPTVETGAQLFMKVSNTMQPLAGAEFRIYKMVGNQKQYVQQAGTMYVTWVTDAKQATKFVSPADGKFALTGLGYGDYFLEETKAPANYQLLARDADFSITSASTLAKGTINIINTSAPMIPVTGGIGTIIFFAGGGLLMLLALMLLRKKKASDSPQ